jgi:hypothetical protein
MLHQTHECIESYFYQGSNDNFGPSQHPSEKQIQIHDTWDVVRSYVSQVLHLLRWIFYEKVIGPDLFFTSLVMFMLQPRPGVSERSCLGTGTNKPRLEVGKEEAFPYRLSSQQSASQRDYQTCIIGRVLLRRNRIINLDEDDIFDSIKA